MEDQRNITLNRIISFLAGGLLIFAIMSFTVVNKVKDQNTELTKALNLSQYEAGRLLSNAQEQFTAGDFNKAMASLNTLFDHQPGSAEAAEGRKLFPKIENEQTSVNAKWEKALPGIKDKWYTNKAMELRAESEASRVKFESELNNTISKAWDKAKDGVKSEWLSQS